MEQALTIITREDLVVFDVTVPKKHAGNFISEFGRIFAVDTVDSGKVAKKVHDCRSEFRDNIRMELRIPADRTSEFYEFMRHFCEVNGLAFENHDTQ